MTESIPLNEENNSITYKAHGSSVNYYYYYFYYSGARL